MIGKKMSSKLNKMMQMMYTMKKINDTTIQGRLLVTGELNMNCLISQNNLDAHLCIDI